MFYVIIFALTFGAVLLLVKAGSTGSQSEKVNRSLARLESYDSRSFRNLELSQPADERLLRPVVARLAAAGARLTPSGRLGTLSDKVERAGRPYGLDLYGLLALKVVSVALAGLLLIALAALDLISSTTFGVLAVAALLFSYYLPNLLLRSWAKSRQRRIARELPDFIDLLTVSVEAGLGLDAAMARIAEKLHDPMREEILITLHHMRIGEQREVALREFARRCQVKELDSFVMALIQSQRLGVSLGKVLRVQSETMRIRRRQSIQERAQKMSLKLVFPLILCIFPAMFVVLLGPAGLRIYESFKPVFGW